jgi:hypothetical protein
MLKAIGITIAAVGALLVIGVAGSDCDGACMQNAMPITDMLFYAFIGMTMAGVGTAIAIKGE